MFKKLFVALSLVFVISLTGCVTLGHMADEESLSKIVVGKTTKNEVVGLLGNPGSYRQENDGSSYFLYSYESKDYSYVPLMGTTNTSAKGQAIKVYFDQADVVSKIWKSPVVGANAKYPWQ